MRIVNTANLSTNLNLADSEWVYNGLDCCVTLEVLEKLLLQLDNTSSNTYQFSLSLQAPILEMALRGVLINQTRRAKVLTKISQEIERLSDQLTEIVRDGVGYPAVNTGKSMWWRSPAQLKNLLYDVMQLPVQRKRNAKGQMSPSTDRSSLEKLSIYFIAEPICAHLLSLRDLDKKRQFLETGIDPDGRLRTSFNIAGTNTGRLASSMSDFGTGTNVQNVDRDLRSIFMADRGYKFANLDLEQADSRNLGALCWNHFVSAYGETFAGAYLDACESGDLHTTVSRMARPHLPWTDDPKANRAIADQIAYRNFSFRDLDKRLGHGSNYLGQPVTMAKHAKVPKAEVEEFQRNYFRAFGCIPKYHKLVEDELASCAQLTTLFGRRRFFFGRPHDPATIREAVAYCPQSMTADEIDTGILNLWRAQKVQLLIQVHDSILLQYPEELEDEIVPWALDALKVPFTLARDRRFVVPTEAKVGWNWGECSEENPDGLIKWRGHDDRKRVETDNRLSLGDIAQ